MLKAISKEEWDSAQAGEINHYNYGNKDNYKQSVHIILKDYFKINLETDLVNKKILESGGGCYPAAYFCTGLKKAVNIEPLYDKFPDHIKTTLADAKIDCIPIGFEDYTDNLKFDEVWFFNVLQHVRDPYLQIENAKRIANVIRVFEPIDCPTNNEHPHSFSIQFFKEQFPDTEVKEYKGGSSAGFHGANCAYLIWTKKE